ncbi:selenide, water dikinase SelD [Alloalcanivorax venustensis]|uniref:selenide, water dikinase SelD n=1 Tax=Alloalcanivorax venustensis TaxID=172371 RepID=UPI00351386C3
MLTPSATQDLIMVGGGHSHALALRMLAMKPVPGLRLTLVSPDSLSAYSGMLPGLVAGHYRLEETHIDLQRLCQATGTRFIRARAVRLKPEQRRLYLDDGTHLEYDLVSLDVGATPNLTAVPGAEQHAVAVKPVADFHRRWQALRDELAERDRPAAITVVGGGAGGTEMALAVAHALGDRAGVSLVTAGALLPGFPAGVRRRMTRRLAAHGVTLHSHTPVRQVQAQRLLSDDRELPHDFLLWCTGVRAASWLSDSGLPCDDQGFVRVNDTLQSPADARVFAAGDCAAFPGDLPKAGVYAVRQAKILARNLAAAAQGQPLEPYRPQRRFLSLLSAGGRDAVGCRGGGPALAGGWVWRWKDRLDRDFMDKFDRRLPRMDAAARAGAPDDTLHCAGCGAKVGAQSLSEALAALDPVIREDIEAGVDHADDAAVIRWPADQRLVQSLDYFPAFVDEPYLFGRIAALHSLSDLFAMNAAPHSALATVCMPRHHPRLQSRDLHRLMAGALKELNAARCTLVGGHTIEGPQMAAGFTVNGAAPPADLWHKSGARPGDVLILTKSLGTGIQLAGLMHDLSRGPWLDATLDSMLRSNGLARDAMAPLVPNACTDITGFGLLGHLLELCEQSNLDARLDLGGLSLLPGTEELVARGVVSTLKPANDQVLTRCEHGDIDNDDPRLAAATDPQTSGGLLFSVDPGLRDAALAALKQAGVKAAVIGEMSVKDHKALTCITLNRNAPC